MILWWELWFDESSQGYLGKEVFVGSSRMMQPLDQQSKELFDGQTQASDLVGSLACTALRDITRAMAIGLQSFVCLWNIERRRFAQANLNMQC